jgi:hypothetical protein
MGARMVKNGSKITKKERIDMNSLSLAVGKVLILQ